MEIWKHIVIAGVQTDYCISNQGTAISLKYGKERVLKLTTNRDGYVQIRVSHLNRKITLYIHRLVGEYFKKNPKNLKEINHFDGNKQNNKEGNLVYCTRLQNMRHAVNAGLIKYKTGKKHHGARSVLAISVDGKIKMTFDFIQEAVAKGFAQSNIVSCCKGTRKKHKGFTWQYLNNEK